MPRTSRALIDGDIPLEELEAMPTLAVGQADDLKIEQDNVRIWLSRCGPEDGEPYPNKVTVEFCIAGVWRTYREYQAK